MSQRLNILHWPTSYPDADRGQALNAIFVEEHIKATQPWVNSRVLFVSPENVTNGKWHETRERIENGIPVTRFYFNRKLNLQFLNLYIRCVLFVYLFKMIIIDKFYPNLIHIHFHQSFFWAKLYASIFRIPIVITEHWSAFLGWPNIGEVRYKNAAQAFNYARKILPVSLKIQKGITTYTGAEIDTKSNVIPNAVNTSIFRYDKTKQLETDVKHLIFIGRNAEEKDLPTLLKGIALTKEKGIQLQLHIVGDGDYYNMEELTNLHQLQQEVILHGQEDKITISKLLNQSDLLLLTSTIENAPCVIGEAHCCGLAVVATDVGGISELIIEGELFEPGNHIQMAEKVIECLKRPINKKELAAKASKKFGYESIGQQLSNVYKELCVE